MSVCQILVTPEAPTTASNSLTATGVNAALGIQASVVTRYLMAAKADLAEMGGHVLLPVTHLMVLSANVHLVSLAPPASMTLVPVAV